MRLLARVLAVSCAAVVPAVATTACGDDDGAALLTLPPIYTTTSTLAPATTVDLNRYFYEVRSGENLNSIAKKFCVPYQELLTINSAVLPDPSLLQVGQMLEIPQGVKVIDCVPASQTTAP